MKLRSDNCTYEGVRQNHNGKLVCKDCGSEALKLGTHLDGDTWFSYMYTCQKCGNAIKIVCDRKDMDEFIAHYYEGVKK